MNREEFDEALKPHMDSFWDYVVDENLDTAPEHEVLRQFCNWVLGYIDHTPTSDED